MHDLAPLTPLGGALPHAETIGTIDFAEITDVALASVTARAPAAEAFRNRAEKIFGALPGPGAAAFGTPYSLIWTGPDQWFAEASFATHEDIAAILKQALGDTASITEQTDGWVRFDLRGAGIVDLLERLCPVPARRMRPGDATRTLLEHMGCLVICRAPGHFSLLSPRSYAGSLQHAIGGAARSIA